MMQKTYLGQKGYTIFKDELSNEQTKKIINDLTIKPFVMGSPMSADQKTYTTYRESCKKIYVPHYYGIEHFGLPKQYKLPEGDEINVEFAGTLRDYQEPVVNKFITHCETVKYGGGLLELPCAWGKTSAALYILSKLKKKTIVIVHKEFLMNQWIERIQQFLPSARVGKIQGKIIDIEDKDIVIGMLQSLSMKEYPASLFDSFGLTIIDEVHHISSEVFSNALFKLVTKHMLGLSATMNRKDGTTFVFKLFLGDVIFKGKRDEQMDVVVRAIDYKVNDEEFNEVKCDYRGNPAYSTMISKLCAYNNRSEFILKVLGDMFVENPKQQVMVLAHNKCLLKYLYDAISHRKIATVGYYVGGMKEMALKETEGKQVVIATYAMASEALDIKTLTTLIMATPKTDIEQSVGRILREKHSRPVVVDIIDSHDLFQNQWRKRKTFYKKENYKIIHITSQQYSSDMSKWTTILNTKNVGLKKLGVSCKGKGKGTNVCVEKEYDEDDDDDDLRLEVDTMPKDKYLTGVCLLRLGK